MLNSQQQQRLRVWCRSSKSSPISLIKSDFCASIALPRRNKGMKLHLVGICILISIFFPGAPLWSLPTTPGLSSISIQRLRRTGSIERRDDDEEGGEGREEGTHGIQINRTAPTHLNIDDVANLVDGHVLGNAERSGLTERPCEHVSGTPTDTMCTTHIESGRGKRRCLPRAGSG